MFVGRQAPDFRMPAVKDLDAPEREATLREYKGRWLVLFFYTGDFTPASAADVRAFNAAVPALSGCDAELLGVGSEGTAAHAAWLRHELGPLGFPLASDRTQTIAQAYGAVTDTGTVLPAVFIIDPDGTIRYEVVHDAGVSCSIDEILRVLTVLRVPALRTLLTRA